MNKAYMFHLKDRNDVCRPRLVSSFCFSNKPSLRPRWAFFKSILYFCRYGYNFFIYSYGTRINLFLFRLYSDFMGTWTYKICSWKHGVEFMYSPSWRDVIESSRKEGWGCHASHHVHVSVFSSQHNNDTPRTSFMCPIASVVNGKTRLSTTRHVRCMFNIVRAHSLLNHAFIWACLIDIMIESLIGRFRNQVS